MKKLRKRDKTSNLSRLMRTKAKLQRNATTAELTFKACLDELGIKYRFQKGVICGPSFRIVDFYVPRAQLVFEIDGDYHLTDKQKTADSIRTQQIKSRRKKLLFVRFSNHEVLSNPLKVKTTVLALFNARYRPPKPSPLPYAAITT